MSKDKLASRRSVQQNSGDEDSIDANRLIVSCAHGRIAGHGIALTNGLLDINQ